jgi:hypothetical protein
MEQTAQVVSVAARNAARDLKILITRLRRQLREVASDNELTASQVSMLTRLAILGESSTSELAGLIQRSEDPFDGRRQILTLTPLGLKRALGAQATWDEWLAEQLQVRYTRAERTTIVDALALLDRLVEF